MLACDLDPHAARPRRGEPAAAGLAGAVTLRRAALAALAPAGLAGRVLLANVPLPPTGSSCGPASGRPRAAAVLSGIRPGDAAALRDA